MSTAKSTDQAKKRTVRGGKRVELSERGRGSRRRGVGGPPLPLGIFNHSSRLERPAPKAYPSNSPATPHKKSFVPALFTDSREKTLISLPSPDISFLGPWNWLVGVTGEERAD